MIKPQLKAYRVVADDPEYAALVAAETKGSAEAHYAIELWEHKHKKSVAFWPLLGKVKATRSVKDDHQIPAQETPRRITLKWLGSYQP